MEFIKIKVMYDDASHCYLVPEELAQDFTKHMNAMYESDFEDQDVVNAFESKFGQYRTGGDINNVQLYIEKK